MLALCRLEYKRDTVLHARLTPAVPYKRDTVLNGRMGLTPAWRKATRST